ncbi:signal peptide peptidase SppA [cyanobacterium TDX16]|nr:signal peptide peptidase SppA [cyanobacterium TDX16]
MEVFMATVSRSISVVTVTLAMWLSACAPTGGFKITPVPADQSLQEQVVRRDPGWISDRIAMIDISGILMNSHEPGLFSEGEHPVSLLVENLAAAAQDSRVKAVVLRINSPGGTVTASDTLFQEIKAFRAKTGKPVVAYFQDVAASGGYYLACAADEIMAQRTTVTGSIGVIMQMVNLTNTMAKLGIESDAIKSGPYKDTGSPFRQMRAEEREIFQGLVDGFYQQFVGVVCEGRPKLTREEVLKLADGRVYNAEQALSAGLIDRIGTLTDAIDAAKARAGLKRAITVRYLRPMEWAPNIYAQSPAPPAAGTNINFLNLNLPFFWTNRPTFMYIWRSEG